MWDLFGGGGGSPPLIIGKSCLLTSPGFSRSCLLFHVSAFEKSELASWNTWGGQQLIFSVTWCFLWKDTFIHFLREERKNKRQPKRFKVLFLRSDFSGSETGRLSGLKTFWLIENVKFHLWKIMINTYCRCITCHKKDQIVFCEHMTALLLTFSWSFEWLHFCIA